ncbi:hypothetical protein OsI_11821 [Oryza sativa Indica Group]|uniref:Uncharacterized protein n=1 Tax=Oryza sativa subsp. indica TaxID=39946 RepID=B8AQJ6_ORYSI|nr:hypothetical protein OsI_11821 [Oryza sativa Indica Group]
MARSDHPLAAFTAVACLKKGWRWLPVLYMGGARFGADASRIASDLEKRGGKEEGERRWEEKGGREEAPPLLATTAGGGIATGDEVGETRCGGWGSGLRIPGHLEATQK